MLLTLLENNFLLYFLFPVLVYNDLIYSLKNLFFIILKFIYYYLLIVGLQKLLKKFLLKNEFKKLIKEAQKSISNRNKSIDDFIFEHKNELSKERSKFILSFSSTQLVEEIKSKRISSREAYICYAIRSASMGRELNLIADCDFEIGLKEANAADKLISNRNKEYLPELIGLPISIKDYMKVKYLKSTNGLLVNHDLKESEDCYVVEILKKKGAIVLCKTNIPQGMLAFESSNRLYGGCENPWNRSKTSGGSSGGESGLVCLKASPVGIGSDIGGSIRNPANNCGIYGFKPTSTKISQKNVRLINNNSYNGFNLITGSFGPIAFCHEDLVLICSALFGEFPNDYKTKNVCFNHKEYELWKNYSDFKSNNSRPLIFGYCLNISRSETCPAIIESINMTLAKLKEIGHIVVEFPFENHMSLMDLGLDILFHSQRIQTMIEKSKGEEPMYFYDSVMKVINTPSWSRKPISILLKLINEKRTSNLVANISNLNNVKDLFNANAIFSELKEKFYENYRQLNLDCLITPVNPFPALDQGMGDMSAANSFFTMTTNILDLPGGSIPTGLLKNNSYFSVHKDSMKNKIEKSVNSSNYMPIGLQLSCLPYEDEKCLGIMKVVDQITRPQMIKDCKELFEKIKLSSSQNSSINLLDEFLEYYLK